MSNYRNRYDDQRAPQRGERHVVLEFNGTQVPIREGGNFYVTVVLNTENLPSMHKMSGEAVVRVVEIYP